MFSETTRVCWLLVLLPLGIFADVFSNEIKWVNVNPGEEVLLDLKPVGFDISSDFLETFMCSGRNKSGSYYPGKLVLNHGDKGCYYSLDDYELSTLDYKMLSQPRATTSWVPYTDDKVLANAIIGFISTSPVQPQTYVCRGRISGSDVVPRLIPGYLTLGSQGPCCHLPLFSKEIPITDRNAIEVLVINLYGLARNVSQQPPEH